MVNNHADDNSVEVDYSDDEVERDSSEDDGEDANDDTDDEDDDDDEVDPMVKALEDYHKSRKGGNGAAAQGRK